MEKIFLRADGAIVLNGNEFDGDPLLLLSRGVEFESAYTLRSFFLMLGKYPLLQRLNEFLPSFLKKVASCPDAGCEAPGVDRLELVKTVEMIGFPGKPRLEIYNSLIGVQGTEACEIKPFPLENLLDIPVILGPLKHVVFGDKVDVFEFETIMTLFECIDGIAWELGFHGAPMECALRR